MPWLLRMTLLVAGIKAIADIYLVWRVTQAVKILNPKGARLWNWLTIGSFFLFYLFPVTGYLQFALGFEVNVLSYPKLMIYLFWMGFAFSFQLLAWIVILDILRIAAKILFSLNIQHINQGYSVLILGISVVVLFFTGLKMYGDSNRIETIKVEYKVKNLPEQLEGFRIVHISDIQADRYTTEREIEKYIELINKQEPDLVIFTGDLISYGTRYIDMAAHQLSMIQAEHGIYFVIGDHDFWAGLENVMTSLREYNIPVLNGENVTIKLGNPAIKLTGITNVYSRNAPISEVKHLTQDTTGALIKILASHQISPSLIEHASANNYDIILGGHTHGGQVRVPVFFWKVSASDFETEYIQGQYYENDMLINVNNGLGYTLAPVRYNAPANITVIELTSQ